MYMYENSVVLAHNFACDEWKTFTVNGSQMMCLNTPLGTNLTTPAIDQLCSSLTVSIITISLYKCMLNTCI